MHAGLSVPAFFVCDSSAINTDNFVEPGISLAAAFFLQLPKLSSTRLVIPEH